MVKTRLSRALMRLSLAVSFALLTLGGVLAAPAVEAHGTSSIHVVNITAKEFAFTMPTKVPTGLDEFILHNAGTQDHMAQFFRLKGNTTESQFITALSKINAPNETGAQTAAALRALLRIASAAGGDESITPGARQDAIENIRAGHYVVVCFDTTPQGVPHFLLGMHKSFWATDNARAARDTDEIRDHGLRVSARVLEHDHEIDMPKVVHSHALLAITVRDQTHEFQLAKIPNGTTQAQITPCFLGPQSACKIDFSAVTDAGGAAAIAPGSTHWVELNLKPGTYVAQCFVPDINTGMPHALMGMFRVFTVVR